MSEKTKPIHTGSANGSVWLYRHNVDEFSDARSSFRSDGSSRSFSCKISTISTIYDAIFSRVAEKFIIVALEIQLRGQLLVVV